MGSYARTAESDWTQVSGTAVVHAGYAFRPDERFTLMPFAGADAAFLHRPSISEEKGRSARLETDEETFRSVRTVFGLKAETADIATASPGYTARGNVSPAFNHELLKHAGDMTTRFTEITGGDFTTDVRFAARSSIPASTGISFRSPEGTSPDSALASGISSGNGTSVGGFGKVQ
ncbi:autotransporter outer membrane beta-barrel domain-containing protein [Oxalobacter aliiformigenes]|nr:autotransporter outer membrane beta-barrel domain-containing protein [Oxalobacter aliiformigenes]